MSQTSEPPASQPQKLDGTQRQSILAQAITAQIAQGGWGVETQGGFNAVLIKGGKRTSHALHFVLTLMTGGVWIIGWIIAVRRNKAQRITLFVDEFGNVQRGAATG